MSDITFEIQKKIVATAVKAGAALRVVNKATPEVVAVRLAICNTCDVMNKETRRCEGKKGGCKCLVDQKVAIQSIKLGTTTKTISCPLKKW